MNKNKKRPQTPKPRNQDWMRARLDHANRENTRPSGTDYKRSVKHRNRQYDY